MFGMDYPVILLRTFPALPEVYYVESSRIPVAHFAVYRPPGVHDSTREAVVASRDDLVKQEQHELEIVEKYLPRQLSDEEIEKIVEQVVQEMGATGLQAMGQVMRAVMPKVKGAADGKRVNAMVKQKLSS